MQQVPAPAAKPPNPARRRRHRKRNHQHERREAHGDEGTLHDVRDDVVDREELIEPDVGQEVQTAVEEGEQPEHAPIADQRIPPGQLAKGRDSERDGDQPQGPHACLVGDRLDGIGAQRMGECPIDQPDDRYETRDEDGRFNQASQSAILAAVQ